MDWKLSSTTLAPPSKPPGWVKTSLFGASRDLTWRTGSATPLRHFIRVTAPLLENNLAKHCEVWVSGNISTHFQKFVMDTGKKKSWIFLKLCCWPRWLQAWTRWADVDQAETPAFLGGAMLKRNPFTRNNEMDIYDSIWKLFLDILQQEQMH